MYLLDTHALVWAIGSPERLPEAAREVVQSGETKVSVISLWELILKKGRRTAPLSEPLAWWELHVTRAETEVFPVRVAHVAELERLPHLHGDPFDRMLVAQALIEDCILVSGDPALRGYGVRVVWESL